MFLKSCLNFCPVRVLKPNCNLGNNYIPTESLILKVFFLTGLINFNNVIQNHLYEVELRMSRSNE